MPISFSTQATKPKSTQNFTPYVGSYAQQQSNPGLITKPTTPVKKITSPDGTSTEFHAPKTGTFGDKGQYTYNLDAQGNPTGNPIQNQQNNQTQNKIQTNTGLLNTPVSSANPYEQIQNVGQAGQQTGNEASTQQRLVELSQNPSQAYKDAQIGYENAVKRLSDFKTKLAETNKNISAEGISLDSARGQMANIGQAATSELDALQQAVNEQQQALNLANTQQGLQLQAGQGAYTGAQTQAGRGLTAQQGVLGAGLYSPTSIGQIPFSGLTGQGGSMLGGQGGLSQLGALQQQQQQGAQTQTMIGAYNQAKPLIETAKQQISSAGFNVSPIGLVNQLNQFVNKGVVPSAEYANIFNTLSEIATTISPVLGAQGAQTDLKTMIAQEFIPKLMQGQSIGMVLDNIEKNSLAKIQASKTTAQGSPLQVPTSGGGQSGGYATVW